VDGHLAGGGAPSKCDATTCAAGLIQSLRIDAPYPEMSMRVSGTCGSVASKPKVSSKIVATASPRVPGRVDPFSAVAARRLGSPKRQSFRDSGDRCGNSRPGRISRDNGGETPPPRPI
jgi:hypothetical protein